MKVIEINPQNPQPRRIRQVVEVLRGGGVVVYPTDTVYGLGCDIFNKRAIERIYRITGQPKTKSFSFICAGLGELSQFATVSNYAYKTMKRLLPGPFTFILPGSRQVPKMMLSRRKTAGIRVPDHPISLAIVRELGGPILTATASLPGGGPISTGWEAAEALGSQVDLVVDGGATPGLVSSVVSLVGDEPEVIREGAGEVDEFRI